LKRLLSLLIIIVLGFSLTFCLDRLYCHYEYIRYDRELGVFAEKLQRAILHQLTDLTAVGDLRAFLLARNTLPAQDHFVRYTSEVKKYYRTVSMFSYTDETGRRRYSYPAPADDEARDAYSEQLAKALIDKKTTLSSPRYIHGRLTTVAMDPLFHDDEFLGTAEVYFNIDIILEQAFNSVSVAEGLFFARIADNDGSVFWEKGNNLDGNNKSVREISIPVGDAQWKATIGWQQFPEPSRFIRALIWGGGGLVTLLLLIIVNGVWARQTWLSRQVAEKTAKLVSQNKAILEAKEAQARAEKLSSLGTMAAGISHEINQPLNSIKILSSGMLYALQAGEYPTPDEIGSVVQGISGQADRISNIITHMRSLIRGDGNLVVPCEINKAVEQALGIVGTQVMNHGIALRKELAEGLPLISVAPTALEEVVINLVINAMQALDKTDRPEKWIGIRTRSGDGVILEVSDNGPGIKKEVLEKIYDPFFSTKEGCDNLGLGLPMVHTIISSCGGTIDVITNENGTTFTICIPGDQDGKTEVRKP